MTRARLPHFVAATKRPTGGGGDSLPAGDTAIIASMGGDGNVPFFYDVRHNLGTSGGVVDTWDDVRGTSGFGPQLSSSGTQRPAYDGTVIEADAVDDELVAAANALFSFATLRTL